MITDNELDATLHSYHRDASTHHELEAAVQRVLATAIEETPQRRSWLPRLPRWRVGSMFSATKVVLAGAIVALFGGLLLSGVFTQPPSEVSLPGVGATTSASAMPEPEATRVGDPDARSEALVVDVIDLPRGAGIDGARLLSTPDAVWLVGEKPATATRIDKESMEVTDVVPVGGSAVGRSVHTSVIAEGSLWQKQGFGKKTRLVEIELSSGEIRNEYRMPAAVSDYPLWNARSDSLRKLGPGWYWSTVIDGAIWGWGYHDQLTRFDLAEREFTTVLEKNGKRYPNSNYPPVATDDAIWLINPEAARKDSDRAIRRFDVTTLEITDALSVDFPWQIAGSSEGVFILERGKGVGGTLAAIHRVDPVTRAITKVIDVSPDAAVIGPWVVYMDGGIWVLRELDGTVSRIDVATGAITRIVDKRTVMAGPPLAFDDAIWVPYRGGTVTRIATVAATE